LAGQNDMSKAVSTLTLENPTFVAYAVAAAIMILKIMAQGWMTVYRMTRIEAGMLNAEDLRPGRLNHSPDPRQLESNEYVERSRRMHRNDLENIPAFLAAGLLFVTVKPPFQLALILMAVFVLTRIAHAIAYVTKQRHEIRAGSYTVGSLVVIFMASYVLVVALFIN
jgi:uncharacterized MAPEG superfamily protein